MVTVTRRLPAGDTVDQASLAQWLESLPPEFNKSDLAYLNKAAQLALRAGMAKRMPASGENQLRHALSVAEILSSLRLDRETLAAAILLGVLNHPDISLHRQP